MDKKETILLAVGILSLAALPVIYLVDSNRAFRAFLKTLNQCVHDPNVIITK